jgi:ribosomal protein S18 acetylase RimI-like enzyme
MNSSELRVYQASSYHPQDASDLVEFGTQEFTRLFSSHYEEDKVVSYLTETLSADSFNFWMSDPGHRIWTARRTTSNEVIGYILCGPCTLALENCEGYQDCTARSGEIKKLYIHPDCFGTGLASGLLNLALGFLHEKYDNRIFLGCWSENFRGLQFYSKFGFYKIGEYDFRFGKLFVLTLFKVK